MVEFKRRVGKNVASERFVRQCSLVATMRFDSGNIHFLHTVFFCCSIFLLAAMPGAVALEFLQDPPLVLSSHVGRSVDFNCSTDDPNAAVSLLFSDNFGASWSERPVTPNKVVLKKQVFTLINIVLRDGGIYACRATDQSGKTIQWPSNHGFFFVQSAELPRHFVLIPNKSIYVLQGQSGEVTCECGGATVCKLKWEKQEDDGESYAAVPESQVTVNRNLSTNRVQAILNITNAQSEDSGTYKCTVLVEPNKSDFKLIVIRVQAPTAPRITAPRNAKTIVLEEGSTKILKCIGKGAPKPNVTWYRKDKQLYSKRTVNDRKSCKDTAYEVYEENEETSGLHTLYTVQVLRIRSVLYPRDQGEFKCVASNGVSDVQAVLHLQVQVDLVKHLKLRPPKPINVLQGQEARVKCDLHGTLTATLEWKKQAVSGDVPVPDSLVSVIKDRSIKRTRAVLKIKYAQMEDSGVYKCVSKAFGKTHFKLAYITVKESLAFLSKPPQVIRGRLGQDVVIDCSTNDNEATVSLLRKPHPFAHSTELKPNANKLSKERKVFRILNIDIGDAGIYSCAATNKANQTIQWPRLTGYFVFLSQEPN